MIVTVTPNPSVDRALDLDRLAVGEVNRAHETHVHAGGKGINVSRALVAHGHPTRAVLPAGGPDGETDRPGDAGRRPELAEDVTQGLCPLPGRHLGAGALQ